MFKTEIVIPARIGSRRLKRKLLLSETGKSLLQHTYEAASQSSLADTVVVATGDDSIASIVESFGGNVALTSKRHKSGTDRVAEVASQRRDVDIIVNVQGDEPEITGADIDSAISMLIENKAASMSTLSTRIVDLITLSDPNCVKVVCDNKRRALYFSRSPIPYARNGIENALRDSSIEFFQHIGVYAYRRDALLEICSLPRSPAEIAESLEQLRLLHHSHSIVVLETPRKPRGINTIADYKAFVKRYK